MTLYGDLWLSQKLFQPSMNVARKVRHGSRLRRHYDQPETPWACLRASAAADPAKVATI